MLRILTWNAATGFEKMPNEEDCSASLNNSVNSTPCASPSIKRKRSFDGSVPQMSATAPAVKPPPVAKSNNLFQTTAAASDAKVTRHIAPLPVPRASLANPVTDHVAPIAMDAEPTVCCSTTVKSKEEARLATMRQTISSQLNLEILMKHRELRLIDQELAKCQIALEQLRRCTEIPYPALQQPSEQVSLGKGPAVRKANSKNAARSPAPWGVVDGPYSRHYAKWLLPDPVFDGGEAEMPRYIPTHGHSTRGHYTDFAQMVGKTSRSQRALNTGLPPGYSEPKPKPTGPMILKRKSDGKMVKLVCPDCARFDFGSAQGFINHCRIGHQRNFASHDAAAEGCGQPLDGEEASATQTAPAPSAPVYSAPVTPITAAPIVTPIATPAVTPAATPAATPIVPPSFNSTTVHPLVKTAMSISRETISKPLIKGGSIPKLKRKVKPSTERTSACATTPHLADYVEKQGLSVDLQEAVTDARSKVDIFEEIDEEEMEIDTPIPAAVEGARRPQVAGKKHSLKSTDHAGNGRKPSFSQREVPRPLSNVQTPGEDLHHGYFMMPLLPSPTNDSTQAPSLIDDDEEMEPQSPPSSDEHDDDVHVHVRDDEHSEESNDLRAAELAAPSATCAPPQQSAQPALANQAAFSRPLSSKGDRPVTFVAEHPMSDDHNDKKRRKLGG